jgi:hypothetical protein
MKKNKNVLKKKKTQLINVKPKAYFARKFKIQITSITKKIIFFLFYNNPFI